jgi:3-hydroxybutyryl-CoA dehydrogenase
MSSLSRVAIIGAGTMGRRIAFTTTARGFQTTVFDTSPVARRDAPVAIERLLTGRETAGLLEPGTTARALGCLTVADTLARCVADADVVIESVPEQVDVKRQVFGEIDRAAPPHALIGTNSSAIPGSWLADATRRPERVFNSNFGTPDDPQVEVMPHPGTSVETLDGAVAFMRALGLVPLVVHKEIVGYAGNRVWRAIKKEVLFLLAGGYSTAENVDRNWMLGWHVPIGPCGLMDKIGLDVVRDIELIYFRASGDPSDRPPAFLDAMVGRGELGEKTGLGFYRYPNPAYTRSGWLHEAVPPRVVND